MAEPFDNFRFVEDLEKNLCKDCIHCEICNIKSGFILNFRLFFERFKKHFNRPIQVNLCDSCKKYKNENI